MEKKENYDGGTMGPKESNHERLARVIEECLDAIANHTCQLLIKIRDGEAAISEGSSDSQQPSHKPTLAEFLNEYPELISKRTENILHNIKQIEEILF